jgi:hypothetical protein
MGKGKNMGKHTFWNHLFFIVIFAASSQAAEPTGKYLGIVKRMKTLEATHPRFAKTFVMGTNDDGVELIGLRVSTTPDKVDSQKVGHLVVGTHQLP